MGRQTIKHSTLGDKLRAAVGARGRGMGWRGTGTKEGTWWSERWVFHAADESPTSTPETNNTLCVNELNLNKKKKIK